MKLTTKHSKITGSKQQGRGDDLPNQDEVPGLGIDNLETIFRNLKVDEITTLKALRSSSPEMRDIIDSQFILNNYHGIAGVRLILIKTIILLLIKYNERIKAHPPKIRTVENVGDENDVENAGPVILNNFCMIKLGMKELCGLNIQGKGVEINIYLYYYATPATSTTPATPAGPLSSFISFTEGYKGTAEQNNQIIQAMDFIFNRIDGWMNDLDPGDEFQISDVQIYPSEMEMDDGLKDTVADIMKFVLSNSKLTEKPKPRINEVVVVPTQAEIRVLQQASVSTLPEFVYVKHDELNALIKKYRETSGKEAPPFSTYLTRLLKALNDPRFIKLNYTTIVTDNVEKGIVYIVEAVENKINELPPSPVQPVLPWLAPPPPPGGNGGSKPKSYKKTADKFKYKKRDYVVYKGTHSGLYIKLDGGYKSVKSITRK